MKLLYLEDLYNFYLNQNTSCTFSSKDTNEPIIVHVDEKIVYEEDSSDNLRVHLQSCHIGSNVNGSKISEKTMKKAIPSFYNKPILAFIHYCEETEQFEFAGHEMTINQDGNFEYIEFPVGNIPESANPVLVYDKDKDKTYLELDGIIYEDYTKAADIIRREKECPVSVEIAVDELSFDAKEKVLNIESFKFTGITLLGRDTITGKKIQPGMQGANVTIADFSAKENSMFEKYNTEEKLIETLDKLNETLKTFNINTEERRNEAMEKEFESVVEDVVEETKEASEEVVITEEEVIEETVVETPSEVEEIEKDFDEETTENFEEEEDEVSESEENNEEFKKKKRCELDNEEGQDALDEEDLTDEEEEDEENPYGSETESESELGLPDDDVRKVTHSIILGDTKKDFAISLNDIIYSLTVLVNETYGETDGDWYSVNVYETDKYVEMYGWNKSYRQTYKAKNGNYSLVGDRVEVFAKYLTQDEINKLENMKANYSSIEEELNTYKSNELDQKKLDVFNNEKYANIKDTKQFAELIENRKDYSVEEIENKVNEMLSFAESLFSFRPVEEKKPKVYGMFSTDDREDKKNQPYGGIFKNIIKK